VSKCNKRVRVPLAMDRGQLWGIRKQENAVECKTVQEKRLRLFQCPYQYENDEDRVYEGQRGEAMDRMCEKKRAHAMFPARADLESRN